MHFVEYANLQHCTCFLVILMVHFIYSGYSAWNKSLANFGMNET